MTIKFHRPLFVRNTPALNALTSAGALEADVHALSFSPPERPARSLIGKYVTRVSVLRRMATQPMPLQQDPARVQAPPLGTITQPDTPSIDSMPVVVDYDFNHFLEAHNESYSRAVSELKQGRKESHWSWFIFPQIRGLGSSPNSYLYGLGSLNEAVAYLDHSILGSRLRQCVGLMNQHSGLHARDILGADARKFHSCLTLFGQAHSKRYPDNNNGPDVFVEALDKYFQGRLDPQTMNLLYP